MLTLHFCFSGILLAQDAGMRSDFFPYDLSHPAEKFILPEILEEISGNVYFSDEIMICIQDEQGDLFFYDLKEKRLLKRVAFATDADFEDLALAGDVMYVLRSNGTIYQLKNFDDENALRVKEIKTRLTKKNNCEGLCYDRLHHRLLIALKGDPEADEDQNFDGFRAIYSYDIEKEKVLKMPEYLIEMSKIHDLENASLYKKNSHHAPGVFEDSGDKKFQPSALAIHPLSGEIYLLASVGKSIIVLSPDGEIISIQNLDKRQFVQPEGISFAPDGTLYISSEGDGGNGIMMKFLMKSE